MIGADDNKNYKKLKNAWQNIKILVIRESYSGQKTNGKRQMIRCNENSEQPLLQLSLQNALKNIIAILIGFQYLQIYSKFFFV